MPAIPSAATRAGAAVGRKLVMALPSGFWDVEQSCNFVEKIMGAFTENISALLPLLKKLQWQEKVVLIQILAAELTGQDSIQLAPNHSYPVWTPLDAYEASDVLMRLLNGPSISSSHE